MRTLGISTLVGRLATRGEIAMAVFASYGIGQFTPMFY
jgi:hypothetical protein